MQRFDTIIFDLGGVLIDWNPRYMYNQLFLTSDAVNYFLADICTNAWNEEQDAGRTFEYATEMLVKEHPQYTTEIRAYYGRWEEMLRGAMAETVEFLAELRANNQFRLYALTNWSGESFPVALQRFDFLHWFEGILVSGDEGIKKPDPAIFHLICSRYNIDHTKAIFIDDNYVNIQAAQNLGLTSIHFKDIASCRALFNDIIYKV
jgi:2-haloacid dehalogenase